MTDATPGSVILADKPAGITSHDLVARVRRANGGVKAGHAGTLDPFATGLMILLLGRAATREQRRFMGLPKTYRVSVRFGAVSTTGDRDGAITETGVLPAEPLTLPTGDLLQRPPAYSAVKVRGVRAYRRARRGEEFELPERQVTVHRFEQVGGAGAEREFEIACSSGTYVRSLVAGLGDAYCTALRRISIGPFSVDEADESAPIDLADALARL